VCRGDLADGDLILVCAPCRERLGGAVQVRATGEFRVPADLIPDAAEPMAPVTGPPRSCTWCGKSADLVRKLLGASTVAICDECVSLCADILEAELGPDWR
jgi:hypothetical protein